MQVGPPPSSISVIRKSYPFLFSKSGILDEFERIMDFNLEERFFSEVDRMAPIIFAIPPKQKEKESLKQLRALATQASDIEMQTGTFSNRVLFSSARGSMRGSVRFGSTVFSFIGNSIFHLSLELLTKFWKMRLKVA